MVDSVEKEILEAVAASPGCATIDDIVENVEIDTREEVRRRLQRLVGEGFVDVDRQPADLRVAVTRKGRAALR